MASEQPQQQQQQQQQPSTRGAESPILVASSPEDPEPEQERQARIQEIFAMFEPSDTPSHRGSSFRFARLPITTQDGLWNIRKRIYSKIVDVVSHTAVHDDMALYDNLENAVPDSHCALESMRKDLLRRFRDQAQAVEIYSNSRNRDPQQQRQQQAPQPNDPRFSSNLHQQVKRIARITNANRTDETVAIFAVGILLLTINGTLDVVGRQPNDASLFFSTLELAVQELESFTEDVFREHEQETESTTTRLQGMLRGQSDRWGRMAQRLERKIGFVRGSRRKRERSYDDDDDGDGDGDENGGDFGEGPSRQRSSRPRITPSPFS
ncbi:MAG: hypothetical protein M1831_004824 [Alyxoria varia]|nr:MAG: hypothetical protein M1831_004824 [Alyxoria varia]